MEKSNQNTFKIMNRKQLKRLAYCGTLDDGWLFEKQFIQ